MSSAVAWVLIDESNGAKCGDGSSLSPAALAHFVESVSAQLNGEFAREHGGAGTLRVGSGPTDIQPGERVYSFQPTLPSAPGASAYHDINGQGVPVAFCAVTTCGSLYGPTGVSVDASHEILETAGDEGCNQLADDGKGTLHAREMCDAVEVQTYGYMCADGTVVQLSNFVLRAWFDPNAAGPYDYMSSAGIAGAVAPPGPMQTAPGDGGNYQIECPSTTSQESQTFAAHASPVRISGIPRKPARVRHWSSRSFRRMTAIMRAHVAACAECGSGPTAEELYSHELRKKEQSRKRSGQLMSLAGVFGLGLLVMDFAHDNESWSGFSRIFDKAPECAKALGDVFKSIIESATKPRAGTTAPAPEPSPDPKSADPDATVRP